MESRGLIKSKPGGGRFIREINKDALIDSRNTVLSLEKSTLLELLEARESIEPIIAEFAAQRATTNNMEIIEEILSKAAEEERAENGGSIEADAEFHLAVARASHNFVFINIVVIFIDKYYFLPTSGIIAS